MELRNDSHNPSINNNFFNLASFVIRPPPTPRRAPPLPAKAPKPSRKQQAMENGVDPVVYQAQMEALNAVGSMSSAIKGSWGRMTNDAKLKKLLLIEGLCESLRSSIFEDDDYRKWAQHRLGAVMSDMKAGQVKQGNRAHRRNKSVNKAAQASARRRTLETKRP